MEILVITEKRIFNCYALIVILLQRILVVGTRMLIVVEVYTMEELGLISSTAQSGGFLNLRLGVGVSHQPHFA